MTATAKWRIRLALYGNRSLELFLDLSATNFLLDVEGQEIGRDVFVNFDAKQLSDS